MAAYRISPSASLCKKKGGFFTDLKWFCLFLNQLQSHKGEPDPSLSFEPQLLRQWVENVLAPLCPTEAQKARERKDLTDARKVQDSINRYYDYFGEWAHGDLIVRLVGPRQQIRAYVAPRPYKPARSVAP